MKSVVTGRRGRRGQLGFTLAELMIAITVGAIILVGSFVLMRHMVIVSAENRDETMAVLQVQYVGFWINEDVVQAQYVDLGSTEGFPLEIGWTEWDGGEKKVTYEVEGMMDGELWRLYRELFVNDVSQGATIVGEYLDPGSTRCVWHGGLDSVLVLQVTANFDGNEVSSTYQINPRALK